MSSKMAKSAKPAKAQKYISLESEDKDNKRVKAPEYSEKRAIVYLSHIPHGFYEKEMRDFFSQFGAVTNLRMGRSKKTGRSKGYAFIEFKYPEVAKIVCETMNNYLMFEKLLKCELIPQERMSRRIFSGKVRPDKPPQVKQRYAEKKTVNSQRTAEQTAKRQRRQVARLKRLSAKLEEAGIETRVALNPHPVMEVDEEDDDIKMKTPPNIKKVKSRSNSAANSLGGTPKGVTSKQATPKLAQKVAEKLMMKKAGKDTPKSTPTIKGTPTTKSTPAPKETPNRTPKSKGTPKGTPKVTSNVKSATPKQSMKGKHDSPKVKKTPKSDKKRKI